MHIKLFVNKGSFLVTANITTRWAPYKSPSIFCGILTTHFGCITCVLNSGFWVILVVTKIYKNITRMEVIECSYIHFALSCMGGAKGKRKCSSMFEATPPPRRFSRCSIASGKGGLLPPKIFLIAGFDAVRFRYSGRYFAETALDHSILALVVGPVSLLRSD